MQRNDSLTLHFNEEEHKYTDSDGTVFKSVTTTIEEYFLKFVPDTVIEGMMRSKNWPQSICFGMTKEEIKLQWKEAADKGTRMHAAIERLIKHSCKDEQLDIAQLLVSAESCLANNEFKQEIAMFYNFVLTNPFHKYCVPEMRIFNTETGIAGTADLVTYNKEGKCRIYDWKRVKQLKETAFRKGKTICADLYDYNVSHYSLQLNLYRHILESCYILNGKPLSVEAMNLVLLHPDNKDFILIPVAHDDRVSLM